VLGDVRLPPTKGGFQVTDAGFPLPDREQDGNPLCRGNGFQRMGYLFREMGDGQLFHIHKPEYMLTIYSGL
jgi:hypothetical protein